VREGLLREEETRAESFVDDPETISGESPLLTRGLLIQIEAGWALVSSSPLRSASSALLLPLLLEQAQVRHPVGFHP
jgi:hypothetical protein